MPIVIQKFSDIKMAIFLFLLVFSQASVITLIPKNGIPPSPRYSSAMIFSSFLNSLIIFGGSDDTIFYNDIWSFDLNQNIWNKLLQMTETIPSNI